MSRDKSAGYAGYAGRGRAPGRGHHNRQDPAGHYTCLRAYIERRSVPTLGRTLVVNFVNSTALSGITQVVHTATISYVVFGLAHDPDTTPSATKPVEPDVTERFITVPLIDSAASMELM
jgi:hypothetical protein